MGEELPSQYDVIILGTGAPETILAAAVARIGKTVLHLDRNEYYGGDWTSFNFDGLLEWIRQNQVVDESLDTGEEFQPSEEFLKEGERFITIGNYVPNISNVKTAVFIEENTPPAEEPINAEASSCEVNEPDIQNESKEYVNSENEASAPFESVENEAGTSADETAVPHEESVEQSVAETAVPHEESVEQSADGTAVSHDESVEHPVEEPSLSVSTERPKTDRKIWSIEELKVQRRKFNLDLAPKLLFSRGPLVELLISSNISRYAEFKSATRVLTYIDEQLIQVPCSRADVFSTKHITVAEKRYLMKFLTFAIDFQKRPDNYRGFEGRPFIEFLQSKNLSRKVQHYIIHAIGMVDPNMATLQSLNSVQKFLESLGRFGNSPFLWPLYGSAELPQCFCRLCAVFGGIYFLKRSIRALVTDAQGKCTAVVSDGQRLACDWLIMESGYAPRTFLPQGTVGKISRGIFITDGSVMSTEKEHLTILCLPADDRLRSAVTILELGPGAYVCPEGLYVVYASCRSSGLNAEEDLAPVAEILFDCTPTGDAGKPRLLWCVYYNQKDTSTLRFSESVEGNVLLTSTPDLDLDYEQSVTEAKRLFEKMFPGEAFLPRAPDPEEILHDTDDGSNPGHEKGEGDGTPKPENDSESEESVQQECKEELTKGDANDSVQQSEIDPKPDEKL